ncbi:MAG: LysR family transcriptional regulator [Hyphomicrobiales bacterium]|nr:LysR family transcriptional regulator [Hyphomicrobiales bacterium]MDE2115071.1 LysR family transcriptional regulator [Hyphomicrobiales bacterium]
MFDWEDYRHFLSLAGEGSLSAASRVLQVDHVTVARRIAALEASLGLKLVDRRARSYNLTAEGERLASLGQGFTDTSQAIDRFARATRPDIGGEVAVSAPPGMAVRLIAPSLVALRAQNPLISLRLSGEMRQASLARGDADLAIRLSRPEDNALVARKIAEMPFGIFGTTRWRELPQSDWAFITYEPNRDDLPQHKWLQAIIGCRSVVLRSNDVESQSAAAAAGLGLAVLPRYWAALAPNLIEYDVGAGSISREVWLVIHGDLRNTPAIRVVADHLAQVLANALKRSGG